MGVFGSMVAHVSRWCCRSPEQDQPSRARRGHCARKMQPNVAKAAGDEVSCVGAGDESVGRLVGRHRREPQHPAPIGADRDLILAIGREDVVNDQSGAIRRGRLWIEIDEATPDVRVLFADDPACAPGGGVVDREWFPAMQIERLRAACHYPESRGCSPFGFDHGL